MSLSICPVYCLCRTMIFHDITDCFFAVEFQFRSNYNPSICFFCFPGTNVNKLEINLGWQTVTNLLRLGICPCELLYCNLYFQSPTVADTRGAQWRIQEGAPTPRGGGGAPTYDFAKISQKLHEIERIWTPRAARVQNFTM